MARRFALCGTGRSRGVNARSAKHVDKLCTEPQTSPPLPDIVDGIDIAPWTRRKRVNQQILNFRSWVEFGTEFGTEFKAFPRPTRCFM
jgi:hypothetical protein